jgi:hypothetical protein
MGKKIVFILGLRTDKNAQLFSCAEFFEMITENKQKYSLEQLYAWCTQTKTLFDSESSDANTKQALFDEAWTKLGELIKTDFKQLCSFIHL